MTEPLPFYWIARLYNNDDGLEDAAIKSLITIAEQAPGELEQRKALLTLLSNKMHPDDELWLAVYQLTQYYDCLLKRHPVLGENFGPPRGPDSITPAERAFGDNSEYKGPILTGANLKVHRTLFKTELLRAAYQFPLQVLTDLALTDMYAEGSGPEHPRANVGQASMQFSSLEDYYDVDPATGGFVPLPKLTLAEARKIAETMAGPTRVKTAAGKGSRSMQLFEQVFLKPGRYCIGRNADGSKRFRDMTADELREYVEGTKSVISAGYAPPVLLEHAVPGSEEGAPQDWRDTKAAQLRNGVGWLRDTQIGGDGAALHKLEIGDPQIVQKLKNKDIRFTSPELRESWTDGRGVTHHKIISHVALTHRPRNPDQPPLEEVQPEALQFSLADLEPIQMAGNHREMTAAEAKALVDKQSKFIPSLRDRK